MRREIKFRGKVIGHGKLNGTYVYGDLIHPWADDEFHPRIREHIDYHKDELGRIWARSGSYDVEEESVAQLIGLDRQGNEIYEGDAIKISGTTAGMAYRATMSDYEAVRQGKVERS